MSVKLSACRPDAQSGRPAGRPFAYEAVFDRTTRRRFPAIGARAPEAGKVAAGTGTRMGMGLVAEGVDTAERRDFPGARGCREAQGYDFARPLTAEAFADRLKADDMLAEASDDARP
jgi:hypothetical protein